MSQSGQEARRNTATAPVPDSGPFQESRCASGRKSPSFTAATKSLRSPSCASVRLMLGTDAASPAPFRRPATRATEVLNHV